MRNLDGNTRTCKWQCLLGIYIKLKHFTSHIGRISYSKMNGMWVSIWRWRWGWRWGCQMPWTEWIGMHISLHREPLKMMIVIAIEWTLLFSHIKLIGDGRKCDTPFVMKWGNVRCINDKIVCEKMWAIILTVMGKSHNPIVIANCGLVDSRVRKVRIIWFASSK